MTEIYISVVQLFCSYCSHKSSFLRSCTFQYFPQKERLLNVRNPFWINWPVYKNHSLGDNIISARKVRLHLYIKYYILYIIYDTLYDIIWYIWCIIYYKLYMRIWIYWHVYKNHSLGDNIISTRKVRLHLYLQCFTQCNPQTKMKCTSFGNEVFEDFIFENIIK